MTKIRVGLVTAWGECGMGYIAKNWVYTFKKYPDKIDYQIFSFTSTKDKPYNVVLEKLEVYDSKKWLKMSICVPSEYVPKLSYPIKIDGSILFGINKKLILKIFS